MNATRKYVLILVFKLIGVNELDDILEMIDESTKRVNYEFDIIDDRMGSIFIEKESEFF